MNYLVSTVWATWWVRYGLPGGYVMGYLVGTLWATWWVRYAYFPYVLHLDLYSVTYPAHGLVPCSLYSVI